MLTDKQIRDAKPRATVYRLRDTQSVCRGFGVVVAPSGSKSFFLSFTSPEDGKRKQVSLGKYPSTKLNVISSSLRNSVCDPALTGTDTQNPSSAIMLSKETFSPFGVSRIYG